MKRTQHNITFQKNTKKSIFVAFFALSLLATMTLIPIDQGVRDVGAVDGEEGTDPTLTLTSTGAASATMENLSDSEKTQLKDGIFIKSSAAEFTVTTDHFFGYELLISAEDDAGNLVGTVTTEDATPVNIASIENELTEAEFSAANATTYSNKWGYYYSTPSLAGSSYHPSPTTTAVSLDKTDAANATANNYSVGFAARINNTIPTGTYSKNVILTAVVNPILYIINYNTNTTSEVTNMPASGEEGTTAGTTGTVSKIVPRREGLAFGGWCTVASATEGECTGELVKAGGEVTVSTTSANNIELYAVWKPSIQQYTDDQCLAEASTSPVTLWDERDGNSYTVQYINGHCWTTQNMSLALEAGMTLSSDTTNLRGLVPEGSTEIVTTTLGTVGVLPNKIFNTYTEARVQVPTEEDLTKTKLTAEANGYWYNYCAATAGQRCEASGTNGGEATIDICPANWKMPSDTEWNNIGGDGSWSKVNVDAFSPVAAGYWYTSTLYNPSTGGYWWSTTAYGASTRHALGYSPSYGLVSGGSSSRSYGFSVRCMLSL
ncbi:MAG: FISUMP domain-containing protein [Candidatus Saccharibacteria bacterium]|nr:FISUMP domain-containing protein [Candidatus Saccharibacteria bacterium]